MALNTQKYYHRDLSWLKFNHRVLQEASDTRNELYERIKFLAIFSSNLDEFFKVRVSDIRKIKDLDKKLRKKLITKPNKLLKKIKKEVNNQQAEFGRIYRNQIIPDLKKEGIEIISSEHFLPGQQTFSENYFLENFENEAPIVLNNKALCIDNEELYLAALGKEEQLIIFKIPSDHNRFIQLPSENNKHYITYLDDIFKQNLSLRYETTFYSLKISRDAELYIDNEYSGDLLDKIKNSLGNRDVGQVTRALIDASMPENLIIAIEKFLDINDTDLIKGGVYHNFKDFFSFPNPTDKKLAAAPLPPLDKEELLPYNCMFDAIKRKDRLIFFPYESFNIVLRWIEEAANDPMVRKIKITMYRIAKDSSVADLLLKALKNKIEVFVFIETKARFDEENNIKWGAILQKHGAQVIYSYPGIKVHSKILYIERVEDEKKCGYGYISTGNFNEKTAKIYTDYGLMTAHKKITTELLQVFQVLDRSIIMPRSKKLLISPFSTRTTFTNLIHTEIENARQGKEACITAKMNSLQDQKIIDLLYQASNAGVIIRLLVRGICCLVPGIDGQSKNISVTSIVDAFLEHGRIYVFANGGEEKMYIGSADWMTRNLDHRIEVITPILDKDIFDGIKKQLNLQLEDRVKARVIDALQKNEYVAPNTDGKSSQQLIYESLVEQNS
ncbi:polyphosphate kinase 1 [Aquimarina addita]|uniref:Polyphosphate kinase n=1 Tax=Aquimarina addita TaxID=870485 RepID=A0ABP7X901_9FLAO